MSVLLGQGSGGPALAMVPADRVLAALHGWLAPLPPEGASAIVFRDVDHAPELAAAQGIRSADLMRNGIVDAIVPEHTDAADAPLDFTARLSATIADELHPLRAMPDDERLAPGWALPPESDYLNFECAWPFRWRVRVGGCDLEDSCCTSPETSGG